MGAIWARNEVTAAARRCDLLIQKNDGSFAPRETDFIDLGYVYISGVTSPHFAVALGTMTNKRRPLGEPDPLPEGWGEIASVDDSADTLEMNNHSYELGDGPVMFTAGTPPAGLSLATPYWVVPTDDDNFSLAESLEDAYAGTIVDITDTTAGATLSIDSDTQRGIDGHFTYEATQEETDHAAPETEVIVHGGTDYDRDVGSGGYTSVAMQSGSSFEQIGEGAHTYGDLIRLTVRSLVANFSKTGNDYVIRDLADSKDSHESTVTPTGKTGSNILDPT